MLSVLIHAVPCGNHWCQWFPHAPNVYTYVYKYYCFGIPASKWQFVSLPRLLEFHVPLFTLCMGSWWFHQSLPNLCTVTCNNTCLPQTHNHRLLRTSIQMFKQGLSCPCSAINTVPGEDGHRARSGRAETRCEPLGPLSSYSVYKAPWCSEENGWTAGWSGTWWGRKAIEKSVSM